MAEREKERDFLGMIESIGERATESLCERDLGKERERDLGKERERFRERD
jgi:hypothetical protein